MPITLRDSQPPHPPSSPASICGLGAITGYGWGQKYLWDGLYGGVSAVQPTPGFGEHFPFDDGWVARVADEGDPSDGPTRFARATRFAAREAVHNALDRGWRPGPTVGVVHALVLGDVDAWSGFHQRRGHDTTKREWLQLMPSAVLTAINQEFDFHGPVMAVSAMCASGVAALLTAKLWLDTGIASDVLVLSTDLSARPENIAGFSKAGVLFCDQPALDTCRPFQEGSRGFVCGEAAVGMVVSTRPDGSYGEVLGGATSHDGAHIISIAPDHEQIFRAFREALHRAGVAPEEVAYLNAHGPGTSQCDAAEARVVDELLTGTHGIFSVKPLVGHCQGASGSVELLASLFGFASGVIPAPQRVAPGHPKLLDGPTACVEGPVVKSSLGMGGYNAVVVLDAPSN